MQVSSPREQEVVAVIEQLADRWAGDADAYADLFDDDAHYVAFDGVDQHGREAIAAAHRPLFDRWLRGSKLEAHVADVTFLGDDVAVAHAWGSIIDRGRMRPKASRLSTQTLVLHRRDGAWTIVAFHNTRVRPVGPGLRRVLAWKAADTCWSLLAPSPRPANTGMPGVASRAVGAAQ